MTNKILIIVFMLMTGCDFTSGLHKDILIAQDYLSKQQFSKAAETYEDILANKPSKTIQIKIRYQLGEIYSIYLNNYSKALFHLKNIIDNSNEPLWQVKALEKIGTIYFENTKQYNLALESYKSLMNFTPKLKDQEYYTFRYAQSLFHLERFNESLKIFKELTVISKREHGIQSYYYLGLVNFYLKNWDKAISYWFEYLKREKRKDKLVQVKFMIANAYESAEKLKEAYNIYYSIIGEYPNPEVIRSRLNSLYERRVARKR